MTDDRQQHIREKAYELWQAEGEPHGRDQEHWAEAERQVGGDAGTTGTQPAGTQVETQAAEAQAAGTPLGETEPSGEQSALPSEPAPPGDATTLSQETPPVDAAPAVPAAAPAAKGRSPGRAKPRKA